MTVIIKHMTDVETELNENNKTNKESEYSIEVLKVLKLKLETEKTHSESF